jgi:hypothetical protein
MRYEFFSFCNPIPPGYTSQGPFFPALLLRWNSGNTESEGPFAYSPADFDRAKGLLEGKPRSDLLQVRRGRRKIGSKGAAASQSITADVQMKSFPCRGVSQLGGLCCNATSIILPDWGTVNLVVTPMTIVFPNGSNCCSFLVAVC